MATAGITAINRLGLGRDCCMIAQLRRMLGLDHKCGQRQPAGNRKTGLPLHVDAQSSLQSPAGMNAGFEVVGLETPLNAALVSRVSAASGTVLAEIRNFRRVDVPSYRSLQIGKSIHIDDIGVLAYLNHSCDPNVTIDVERLTVIALRDIAAGDALTLFYPSTEWEMAQPFPCRCGSDKCLRWIRGARYVSPEVLRRYPLALHIVALAGLNDA
jgi:hypothetical protein